MPVVTTREKSMTDLLTDHALDLSPERGISSMVRKRHLDTIFSLCIEAEEA